MKTDDFVKELQKIDPRITIVPNPNRPGISNIFLDGVDLCPVPSDEIKEDLDPHYFYTFPNGMSAPHNWMSKVRVVLQQALDCLQTEKGKEIFYAKE